MPASSSRPKPGPVDDLHHAVLDGAAGWPTSPARPGRARDRRSTRRRCRAGRRRAGAARSATPRGAPSRTPAGRAERGGAPPVGDAAALGGVVVDEIDRARVEQPAHAVAGDLALAGGDRDARRPRTRAIMRGVVVPVAGLLEPADVERLDEPREADRVLAPSSRGWRRRPARSRRPAALRAASTRSASSSGARPPTLNLQPAMPARAVGLHLAADVGERLALHVVAADGDDRAARRGSRRAARARCCPAPCRPGPRRAQSTQAIASISVLRSRLGVVQREQLLPDALAVEDAHALDAAGASSSWISRTISAPCSRLSPL